MSGNPGPGRATAIAALQAALAAEHAAVFGYGVAGGQMAGAALARAQLDWSQHEQARDALAAALTSMGAAPVAAAVDYRLPFQATGPRAAAALAAYLEDQVAAAYLGLVALPGARWRGFGAREVTGAALRAAAWRGSTQAFPGLPGGPASSPKAR